MCVYVRIHSFCTEKLQSVADEVFEDVVDEFSTLPTIRQHFERWKAGYADSYSQAFMSLCLPKVIAPFARLQMLMWSPLQVSWMAKPVLIVLLAAHLWWNFFCKCDSSGVEIASWLHSHDLPAVMCCIVCSIVFALHIRSSWYC